jgi:hypothetical protein
MNTAADDDHIVFLPGVHAANRSALFPAAHRP